MTRRKNDPAVDLRSLEMTREAGFVEEGARRLKRAELSLARRDGKTPASSRRALGSSLLDLEGAVARTQERELAARKMARFALPMLSLAAEKLAFICIHSVLTSLQEEAVSSGEWPHIVDLARAISNRCEAQWKADHRMRKGVDLIELLKRRRARGENISSRVREMACRVESSWSEQGDIGLHLGCELITLALQVCKFGDEPIFEKRLHTERWGKSFKTTLVLGLSPSGIEWWTKYNRIIQEIAGPTFQPMIVPPRDWTSPNDGGYLDDFEISLVKTGSRRQIAAEQTNLEQVFKCVNALQNTAWKINADVYRVMRRVWKMAALDVTGFPTLEKRGKTEIPPALLDDAPPELIRQRQVERAIAYKKNISSMGSRARVRAQLSLAWKLKRFSKIYFPYHLDARGRAYPLPQGVHPQADDVGRSLLTFAEGVPIGKDGGKWLEIHLANMFGLGKLTFEERRRWVVVNVDNIISCAVDPEGSISFWRQADRPWSFLAACFEYRSWRVIGEDFESSLPISMDGSCNGLQHLSAIARDEPGAKATNVFPGKQPEDVYASVASKVNERLRADRERGIAEAQAWSEIGRGHAKHATMATPYGITIDGIQREILEQINAGDYIKTGNTFNHPREAWVCTKYLARLLSECVAEVVVSAQEVKTILLKVVDSCAEQNRGVHWTLPTGLRVDHEYRIASEHRISTSLGTLVTYRGGAADRINMRKQRNAIVANVVHSLDAAHMMMTVNRLQELGMSHFSMVHDSYAVHACNVPAMNKVLREEFVKLYERDMLKALVDEQVMRCPDIRDISYLKLGKLEIHCVQQSKYFFS